MDLKKIEFKNLETGPGLSVSIRSGRPGSYESHITKMSDIIVSNHEWSRTRRIGRRDKLVLHKIGVSI